MTKQEITTQFNDQSIRSVWDDKEENEMVTNCNQLKLRAADGRYDHNKYLRTKFRPQTEQLKKRRMSYYE